jgi:uncharacterized protein (DUF983 family)
LCGKGKLFRGWIATNDRCNHCGADLKREPGFYLGSIYYNYGLTSLIVMIAYPILLFSGAMTNDALLYASLAFVVVFPLWFFRYARSLWLGFDQLWDPKPGEIGTSHTALDHFAAAKSGNAASKSRRSS